MTDRFGVIYLCPALIVTHLDSSPLLSSCLVVAWSNTATLITFVYCCSSQVSSFPHIVPVHCHLMLLCQAPGGCATSCDSLLTWYFVSHDSLPLPCDYMNYCVDHMTGLYMILLLITTVLGLWYFSYWYNNTGLCGP